MAFNRASQVTER